MDQVTLVGPQDMSSLKLHMLATAANLAFIDRTFYIHADTPEVTRQIEQLRSELPDEIEKTVIFIPEEQLLPPSVCANKWIYQQLLKLSVDQLRDSHELSEPFFFTDVDTLCLRRTVVDDFRQQDRFMFFFKSDNTKPVLATDFNSLPLEHRECDPAFQDWYWAMTWSSYQLLGLETAPRLGAVDACVIWSQKVLKKLKRDIEKRFSTEWHNAIVCQFVNFILTFKNNFSYSSGTGRSIAFAMLPIHDNTERPGFDELYHTLRLGFSEWQLYAHFLTTLEKTDYIYGLLGDTPHPLVAEYNLDSTPEKLLDEALDAALAGKKRFPNFLYFYPNVGPRQREKVAPVVQKLYDQQGSPKS